MGDNKVSGLKPEFKCNFVEKIYTEYKYQRFFRLLSIIKLQA